MRVELINTGTELLLGDVVNTNAAWLGQRMVELGLQIERSTCVPDGIAIEEALREACHRSDVVIVTGGLGPTADDVSREAAAVVLGLALEMREDSLRTLEEYFGQRGRTVNDHNKRQALAPQGAQVLPNSNGTAPGLYLPPDLGMAKGLKCGIFLLPGPPRELKAMVTREVEPRLRALLPDGADRVSRYLKFTGLGESDISMELHDPLEKVGGLEIGYCIGKGDVDVRLTGPATAVERGVELSRERLGEYLISDDRRVLEEVVVDLLK